MDPKKQFRPLSKFGNAFLNRWTTPCPAIICTRMSSAGQILDFKCKQKYSQVPMLRHQFWCAERHFHCWHTWHPQWGEAKNRWEWGWGRSVFSYAEILSLRGRVYISCAELYTPERVGVYFLCRKIHPWEGSVYLLLRNIHSWERGVTDDVLLRGFLPYGVPTHQFNWPFAESRCLSRVQSYFHT